jgi:hypothetical protein
MAETATKKRITFTRSVMVTINDPEVIERFTGPDGDEVREQSYDLRTEEDVLSHLAYNCLVNGYTNARRLDGFADLPADAVTFEVETGYELLAVSDA